MPTTSRELRRFLGMINFYLRLVAYNFAISARLQTLTVGSRGPEHPPEEQRGAFKTGRDQQSFSKAFTVTARLEGKLWPPALQ